MNWYRKAQEWGEDSIARKITGLQSELAVARESGDKDLIRQITKQIQHLMRLEKDDGFLGDKNDKPFRGQKPGDRSPGMGRWDWESSPWS